VDQYILSQCCPGQGFSILSNILIRRELSRVFKFFDLNFF
jgi:hypothetical protein